MTVLQELIIETDILEIGVCGLLNQKLFNFERYNSVAYQNINYLASPQNSFSALSSCQFAIKVPLRVLVNLL